MILLTGATGTVGRHVVGRLAGSRALRVLTRSGTRPVTAPPGALLEVVPGDYADRESLAAAMTGVHAVLVVTSEPLHPEHDAHLLAAAASAGVRHLVKLSALAVTDPHADDLITRWQRTAERRIRDSGLTWTFLRPRSYMSNTLGWARTIAGEGVVRTPHPEAPNATVDPRDVAEVAALALTEPGHENRAYALTGPEPLTPRHQAGLLSDVAGRELRVEELGREEHRRLLLARYPAPVADALCASADRQRRTAKAATAPDLHRLLGRPARSYRDWAADHASAMGLRPARVQLTGTASTTEACGEA